MARVRFLPVLIFLVALAFGVRLGEFVNGMSVAVISAYAVEKVEADPPPMKNKGDGYEKDAHDKDEHADDHQEKAKDTGGKKGESNQKKPWREVMDAEIEFSPVQMELFEDLSKRRKELEAKEADAQPLQILEVGHDRHAFVGDARVEVCKRRSMRNALRFHVVTKTGNNAL